MTDRRCLTPDEYALERKVSTRTVYRLIKSGQVKAERVGAQWRIWLGRRTTHDTAATTDTPHV
jgi:excisionase family DNA binding protein